MQSWLIPLVEWTEKGLYCRAGVFYIDPHRAVDTAVVTHAHSDHARKGSSFYICAQPGLGLLKCRLGQKISAKGIPYGEVFQLGGVQVSLHSAGHILGSAQVRIEHRGEVWVVSGDYKRDLDPSCHAFESVPCDVFITEATFGTPSYAWDKNQEFGKEISTWWSENAEKGKNSILFGYSLGKAQRILAELAPYSHRPILTYHTIVAPTQCYLEEGRKLAPIVEIKSYLAQVGRLKSRPIEGELILAPPSILEDDLADHLGEYETAFASGWMQIRSSPGYGLSYDRGFVMSDHADWNDLNRTIEETGARQIFVLHRSNGALVRHLRKKGLNAHPVATLTPSGYQGIAAVNLSLF